MTDRSIRVVWLGHATVVLEIDGVRILTDPLLLPNAGPLRRRTPVPDPDHWRDSDAVLLSHLHADHAELGSLRLLGGTPLLTATENLRWIRRRRLPAGRSLDDDWVDIGTSQVQVRAVRADHRSRPMPHRPNAANGHLVRGPSGVVWVAGDTSLHPEMSSLAELAGRTIDLALVPVGGWGPRLSPGHMGPDEAATAVARAGARWAVPVHWGTLHPPFMAFGDTRWLDEPGERFAAAVEREVPSCRPLVLAPGEEAVVGGAGPVIPSG